MEKEVKIDEIVVNDESVEETRASYVSRRTRTVRTTRESVPTNWAEPVYVIEESEQYEEEPSEHAEIKLRITEVPADPAPTERAEVNFQLADSGGSIHVPERFTGQLIDGCIVIGCAVSTGLTTKWVLETAMDSMQGWMVLTVVTAQVAGIAVLAWRAMRRQRQA